MRPARGFVVSVFADHVTATMPAQDYESWLSEASPILDEAGFAVDFTDGGRTLWRRPDPRPGCRGGTVDSRVRSGVRVVSATGSALAAFRSVGVFLRYLAALGNVPHRVTRLDASLDVPGDAAPVVRGLAQRGQSGGLKLTRKAVPAGSVTSLFSTRFDGELSGTVYVGARHSDVRLCVYDKAMEREQAGDLIGSADHRVRYELRLGSGAQITLRDAAEPEPVFWHYMRNVLDVPDAVPAWSPRAEGFAIDRPPPLPAAERIRRRVAASADIGDLLALVDEPHSGGLDWVFALIRQRYERHISGASAH